MATKDILKVLVVDDHISSRMVTVEALKSLGIKGISVAKDGQEAFNQIVGQPVHLLISDLYMPNINGFQLIKAVRSHPKIAKTGCILITGKKDDNVVNTSKKLGVNNVLAKPFSPVAMKAAIETVVGKLD